MTELTLSKMLRFLMMSCSFCCAVVFLAACGAILGPKDPIQEPASAKIEPGALGLLQVGDLVKIDFSGPGNPPQPVEQHIRQDGTISLYLIDTIKAAGKTPGDLQKEIQALYVPSFYKHLNVIVRAVDQLYYVGGQVRNGGRQPYLGPVTVLGAIKASGDFTDFANRKKVKLIRADGTIHMVNCVKALESPELDLAVYPGDKIDVPQKRF